MSQSRRLSNKEKLAIAKLREAARARAQPELALAPPITLADRIRELASTMKVSACPECGRRGYHLVTCSIGRSAL